MSTEGTTSSGFSWALAFTAAPAAMTNIKINIQGFMGTSLLSSVGHAPVPVKSPPFFIAVEAPRTCFHGIPRKGLN